MKGAHATVRGRLLLAALGTTVAATAAPYGYTISIWSSGAVLMDARVEFPAFPDT
jgi:hypothetical protein